MRASAAPDTEMSDRRAEVLVVGAGPAGAVAALLLGRAGVRVLLRHRPNEHGPAIGEVLPPPARPVFERLGLAEVLEDAAHLSSPGTVTAWGSDHPRVTDALFSPYGSGLHLDRGRFESHLRAMAMATGVTLQFEPNAARTAVTGASADGLRVILDCTGRAAVVARSQHLHVERHDALVAVVGILERGAGSADRDARTFVAAVANGWWYSALLPDGRRSAAFLTDRDLLPVATRREPLTWFRQLLAVPVMGDIARRSGAQAPASLSVRAADSRRVNGPQPPASASQPRTTSGGPALVLAGDATMAFDPLSSMGILAAVESAAAAVPVVLAHLVGDTAATQAASRHREEVDDRRWAAYRERLADAYAEETRWAASPFWVRRQLRARWPGDGR